MQYATTILLGLLATTGVTAPIKRQSMGERAIEKRADGPLKVSLDTDFFDGSFNDFFAGLAAQLLETNLGEADTKTPRFAGPYRAVTLDTRNGTAAARCQLIDNNNMVVTLVRGANVDVSFGDGGNGPWRAQNGRAFTVKQIKCDPNFKSANSAAAK
ncbi:hypothetical protein PG984_009775 [Apiospora sp. TS-2023a]